ncbi:uncharacterized protein MONBRDRAFT_39368 [Monosiga brevicollis MX1]|uniref:arginine--tRNA ligase n=1 Tax=Monosiga brevicollis TaxID=81824 RepID=A9VE62_MONBE|nr:uncharacterized protein MONBRDRAFT_39368 [Monosiga brevicollis MX1]EDQ84184.1 predicted protein [Monosiga brevicollis MX1]|eukprot:XP_001751014.1 hypothetical protein [Monosiga brevicollis MX1]
MEANALFDLEERCRLAERTIKELEKEITDVTTGRVDENAANPALQNAIAQNRKLKYQLEQLTRAMEAASAPKAAKFALKDSPNHSLDLMSVIVELVTAGIRAAFPQLGEEPVDALVSVPSGKVSTDAMYQSNAAMRLAAQLKAKGTKMPPREVAAAFTAAIPKNDIISGYEIAGPGFVNIDINTSFLEGVTTKLLNKGVLPPEHTKQPVIVDFSSPNIAKEMHVGHLRSTIIGESIARMLEYIGHDVQRVNHVGDWGTPFGMLICHLRDKFPNFQSEPPSISDLQGFYKAAKKRFDEEPEFKPRVYEAVVKLQAHDPETILAWNLVCDVSRREFQRIYDRLDIDVKEKGESFYQDMMVEVVKQLESAGKLEEDDTAPGRKIAWSSVKKETKVPLIVVKSDGARCGMTGYTYDTSDLAALRYRASQATWLVYVVDNGQSTHFQNVFALGRDMEWVSPKHRVDHVGFGVVLGEDGKRFKTRSGDTVRLKDLLDEGVERAGAAARTTEMTPEQRARMVEAIAYGCIKYADLSHNRTNDYVFSYDKMLQDKGNTAVYLLYANTRVHSILRNPEIAKQNIDIDALAPSHTVTLTHPKEIKIAKYLARFPEVLNRTIDTLMPHRLCDYIYELTNVFTEFYQECYAVQKQSDGSVKVDVNRLMLYKSVGMVLEQAFHLLGIRAIEAIPIGGGSSADACKLVTCLCVDAQQQLVVAATAVGELWLVQWDSASGWASPLRLSTPDQHVLRRSPLRMTNGSVSSNRSNSSNGSGPSVAGLRTVHAITTASRVNGADLVVLFSLNYGLVHAVTVSFEAPPSHRLESMPYGGNGSGSWSMPSGSSGRPRVVSEYVVATVSPDVDTSVAPPLRHLHADQGLLYFAARERVFTCELATRKIRHMFRPFASSESSVDTADTLPGGTAGLGSTAPCLGIQAHGNRLLLLYPEDVYIINRRTLPAQAFDVVRSVALSHPHRFACLLGPLLLVVSGASDDEVRSLHEAQPDAIDQDPPVMLRIYSDLGYFASKRRCA